MVNRRFNQESRKNNKYIEITPEKILNDYHAKKVYIEKERTLLSATGSPFLWFIHINKFPCSCFNEILKAGNTNCPTCFGTGSLRSFEKNGYMTFTFSKTYPDTSFIDADFVDGWGYKEIITIKKGKTAAFIITPWIDLTGLKELVFADPFIDAAQPGLLVYVEITYDEVNWFRLDDCPIDFTQSKIKFRVAITRMGEPPHGGVRHFRVRFRKTEFVSVPDVVLPNDVYIQIATPDFKYARDLTSDRERKDFGSVIQAWTIDKVDAQDLIYDVTGVLNEIPNTLYLINNIVIGSHESNDREFRRNMDLRIVPRNSFNRGFYKLAEL